MRTFISNGVLLILVVCQVVTAYKLSEEVETGNNVNKLIIKARDATLSNKEVILFADEEQAKAPGAESADSTSLNNMPYNVKSSNAKEIKAAPETFKSNVQTFYKHKKDLPIDFAALDAVNSQDDYNSPMDKRYVQYGNYDDVYYDDDAEQQTEQVAELYRQLLEDPYEQYADIENMLDESQMSADEDLMSKLNTDVQAESKPVKKFLDTEEKLISDTVYNKNPFFQADVVRQLNEAGAAQNAPGMAQHSKNHHDPNLSANIERIKQQNDYLFSFVVAGCSLAGIIVIIAASICLFTVYKGKQRPNIEYGLKSTGSTKSKSSTGSGGDRRLAQSAQMYHYQHQKQQMIAMEKANNETKADNSDNSDGETEEGDYTVYECPGLAPTGEMEVKNPLFQEDFSQSSNNILAQAGMMPPAYSSVATDAAPVTPAAVNLVTTEINEKQGESKQDEQKKASEEDTVAAKSSP